MKIGDLEQVNGLMKQRDTCINARSQAEVMIETTMDDDHFYGTISRFEDGSGRQIQLNGTYVAVEVAEATIDILTKKIATIDEILTGLGVEL